MQMLHVPAALDQFGRKPIEQFWIARGRRISPKFKGIGCQRRSHMPIPNMVNGHSGRQRIAPVGNPFGKRLSPASALTTPIDCWVIY